jgi:chromosome segregation ATPase
MTDIIERLRIESRREPHEPIWRDAIDEIEALREALAALKAENARLRQVLKDADNELDWLDGDIDTCDHSVGVCMCDYWNMRREMKAALENSDD